MFPLEEVKDYLSNVLGLSNVDQFLTNPDKLEIVTTILRAHVQIQPFQNVSTFLSIDYVNRHRPTWGVIKSAMFRKEGGVCYHHHYLFYEMLNTLKFNVGVVKARYFGVYTHLVILLRDLVKKGDVYLLEAGSGYPTFQPICLDFEKESPIFCESFVEYKYIKHEGLIIRVHKGDDKGEKTICESKRMIDGWRELYGFSVEDDEVSTIRALDDMYEIVMTDKIITPFHDSLRWICFPNFRARIFVDKTVMEENSEHKLVKKELKNTEEIVEAMHELSPVLDDYIIPALNNLKLFE
ncbi:hypothetical protein LOTGIDRAFT_153132 [Lottia gigantea]|uniref:arylamine N-acetyltransferase n=1 Tax=Lottia gigantea TaxID=225164 RepID=V4AEU0_LOTGI|nr:hypothetical protein LOTGIDRAFT_153132 [Lottia gigantea]ESO93680.1 hypothetical protein LOTGIDRAFT_153132 [Lottia gigantea]